MSTLLLRLTGPMQSWGTQSRFTIRDAGIEPSKSGVIGLLCAALGWPRDSPLVDFRKLKMGVRVDREGVVMMDYHTVGGTHRLGEEYGVATADSNGKPQTLWSNRYYLADADFLVGLECDDDAFLDKLDRALADPVWPLFLGRKSFLPGVPIRLPDKLPVGPGLRPGSVVEVLSAYRPWPSEANGKPRRLRLVVDADPAGGTEARSDVPTSFVSDRRQYELRYVRLSTITAVDPTL